MTAPRKTITPELRQRITWGFVIFVLALGLRLLHTWQIHSAPFFGLRMGDADGYHTWARTITDGNWLGDEVFYQAPLYPYFLAILYSILGDSHFVVAVCQSILGALSCVFLTDATWKMFSKSTGIAAGLMLSVYAPAIFFDALIQKSSLDLFLMCVTIWLLSRAQPVPTWKWSMILGAVIGLLILTRENSIIFIFVILFWMLVHYRNERRASLMCASLFIAGTASVLLPVAVRNQVVGGEFHLTTSQFGPNFYIGNNENASGFYQPLVDDRGNVRFERADATRLAEEDLGRKLSPAEVSDYWSGLVFDYIRSQPLHWARLMFRKFSYTWNSVEITDTEDQYTHADWSLPLHVTGPLFHFGVLVPLAIFGLCVTSRDRNQLWVFYFLTAAYAASVIMFYVMSRYRFPLVPLLIPFAAAGLIQGYEFIRSSNRLIVSMALVSTVSMAIFCNWPVLDKMSMYSVTQFNLGTHFETEGNPKEAAQYYRRSLKYHPDDATAHFNLGEVLLQQGKLTEAIAHFQRALRIRPDFSRVHFRLGSFYAQQGDFQTAVTHFQSVIQNKENVPYAVLVSVLYQLGTLQVQLGDLQSAADYFERTIREDPDFPEAHLNLGTIYLDLGNTEKAIEHFQKAIELESRYALAHNNLGAIYLGQKKLEAAIHHFEIAVQLYPEYADARNNLDRALKLQKKNAK